MVRQGLGEATSPRTALVDSVNQHIADWDIKAVPALEY